MNSNRQLGITTGLQAKSSEKLSSGYKINRAADDAAGLAISEKMRRQIRGLDQASKNAQDGISLVQVADGAMAEVHDMLQRGNELAVKAANDTLTADDRSYIQQEIDKIKEEINAINGKATFNERYVLRGSSTGDANLGSNLISGTELPSTYVYAPFSRTPINDLPIEHSEDGAHMTASVNLINYTGTAEQKAALDGKGFHFSGLDSDNIYNIKFVNGEAAQPNPLVEDNIKTYSVDVRNITSGDSLTSAVVLGYHAMNISESHLRLAHWGGPNFIAPVVYDDRADQDPIDGEHGMFGMGLYGKNEVGKDLILQVGSETAKDNQITLELPYVDTNTCKIAGVNVTTREGALAAIGSFKGGLEFISEERSRMGAYQNRLEHTVKNLDNVVENTQDAESLIRDTDMAAEMVKYSNDNILAQAGQSMLAQANQTNQGVLSLLQ